MVIYSAKPCFNPSINNVMCYIGPVSRPILEVKTTEYIESWELMDHGDEAIDCACKIVIKPS